MHREAGSSKIIALIAVLLFAATVSGCASAPAATPGASSQIATPAYAPTPVSNQEVVVNDYSASPTKYATTLPLELSTRMGENIVYGRLTMNGNVPSGYVYSLVPSAYQVSGSDEPVDAIGLLWAHTISMSYAGSTDSGTISGASMVTAVGSRTSELADGRPASDRPAPGLRPRLCRRSCPRAI